MPKQAALPMVHPKYKHSLFQSLPSGKPYMALDVPQKYSSVTGRCVAHTCVVQSPWRGMCGHVQARVMFLVHAYPVQVLRSDTIP
jgi:hypothetical protein